MTLRIAMWSGPRNISTAMMRSWENRPDCTVIDEPFYACYLAQTQSPHPMFDEVVASQSQNVQEVAKHLGAGDCPSPIQYQKHMTMHMLQNDFAWAKDIKHCFLIRDPAEVVNSYTNSRGVCTAEDIGINRQLQIYQRLTDLTEQIIPVMDSNEVLKNPALMLSKLCAYWQIPFYNEMLSWPKGRRDSDGVWAAHWYHSVEESTGFAPWQKKSLALTRQQLSVVGAVTEAYEQLKSRCLSPD